MFSTFRHGVHKKYTLKYRKMHYDTIIDYNEVHVDIRIYLLEKSDIHQGRKAEMNITLYGR